jgi:hypothetical protein
MLAADRATERHVGLPRMFGYFQGRLFPLRLVWYFWRLQADDLQRPSAFREYFQFHGRF